MRRSSRLLAAAVALAAVTGTLLGCDDTPTTAVVENAFAPGTTVSKAWWVTTLFPYPVAAGATSETERTIPGKDFAYALLARTPSQLIALKSSTPLEVSEHGVLRIAVSDATFTGDCAAGEPLGADDAALIVERIFPGDFAGETYDPATCTATAAGGP